MAHFSINDAYYLPIFNNLNIVMAKREKKIEHVNLITIGVNNDNYAKILCCYIFTIAIINFSY